MFPNRDVSSKLRVSGQEHKRGISKSSEAIVQVQGVVRQLKS
jgi:hypothetical protein